MSATRLIGFCSSLTLTALCTGLVLAPAASQAASTSSQASTSVSIGSAGDGGYVVNGPVAAATSVNGHTLFTVPGTGSVDSRLEARAEFGALHARATVQTAAPYSSGMAGSSSAGDPDSAAYFDDQVTVGGGGGPQVFKLYYTLTGSAGQTGSANMQFAADLSLQAWGTSGISITSASAPPTGFSVFPPFIDTYSVSVGGTGPQAFSDSGWVQISAESGATLNLSGALGAWLRLSEPGDTAAPSTAVLDIWHTGSYYIVPDDPGTTFTSVSGFNYLAAAPVPEPAPLPMMALALPLLGGLLWRRRQNAGRS
ncbi:MAG: PEP-CTERM sorting domain-containing protein [Leptothrix sp. (in: Bacteria)]|jgi:hypothetical protein|nr:PEP-CTERM sorting domain-containing protein [Leptothrix sp. (in: b-proteobacteria)]HQY08319.1 PEP-CTERM sorting domain-containing protein [Burkholderiaceae bacterium]